MMRAGRPAAIDAAEVELTPVTCGRPGLPVREPLVNELALGYVE